MPHSPDPSLGALGRRTTLGSCSVIDTARVRRGRFGKSSQLVAPRSDELRLTGPGMRCRCLALHAIMR